MKKIIVLMLALVMTVMMLTGCSVMEDAAVTATDAPAAETTVEATDMPETEPEAETTTEPEATVEAEETAAN